MARRRPMLVALALGALSIPAWAQDDQPPLAGPEITPRGVPGVREAYRPGEVGGMDSADTAVPLGVYLGALRGLAGTDHELTAEQSGMIRGELRRYRDELAAFMEASAPEIRALLEQLPADQRNRAAGQIAELERLGAVLDRIDRAGGIGAIERPTPEERRARRRGGDQAEPAARPDQREHFRLELRESPADRSDDAVERAMGEGMTEDGEMTDAAADPRARLLELRDRAPSVAKLETRVWELLTEPQRGVIAGAVESFLAEQRERVQESRLQRDIERRKAEAAQRQTDRAIDLGDARLERILAVLDKGEIPERLWERLPERMRERVESLPEDERAPALARYLRQRAQGQPDRPDR